MSAVGPFLRRSGSAGETYLFFWCPACDESHMVRLAVAGRAGGWTFNENPDAPTFQPSVLVTSGHYLQGRRDGAQCYCSPPPEGEEDWGFRCVQCHSFVTDGRIQFLGDCSHALAGQTVPLPPFPADHHIQDGSDDA